MIEEGKDVKGEEEARSNDNNQTVVVVEAEVSPQNKDAVIAACR